MAYSSALAQYGTIQGMVLPLILFPMCFLYAFSQVLVPEISKLNVQERYKRIKQVISKIFKTTMIFAIFVGGIFFCYAEEFSQFMFKRTDIAYLVRIFAFCMPVTYFDVIVDSLLKGLDKQVSVVNINILDSLFTIALILTLIPAFGLIGYIIVFFASEFFNAVLSIGKLLKTTACSFDFLNWFIKPLIAVVCACFCQNIVMFLIVFFALLVVTKAVNLDDFRI